MIFWFVWGLGFEGEWGSFFPHPLQSTFHIYKLNTSVPLEIESPAGSQKSPQLQVKFSYDQP